mmetsp:Transcript_39403/g.76570  ORF Transcript_39403/g.76570 Transcript_39403/m.76570 type:complete len:207 (+) Transcript_39403:1449-2069(+)
MSRSLCWPSMTRAFGGRDAGASATRAVATFDACASFWPTAGDTIKAGIVQASSEKCTVDTGCFSSVTSKAARAPAAWAARNLVWNVHCPRSITASLPVRSPRSLAMALISASLTSVVLALVLPHARPTLMKASLSPSMGSSRASTSVWFLQEYMGEASPPVDALVRPLLLTSRFARLSGTPSIVTIENSSAHVSCIKTRFRSQESL